MPTLPLTLDTSVDGDLPVNSSDDVLAVFPDFVQKAEIAPVRDRVIDTLTEIIKAYQTLAEYASAQSDPERAVEIFEDGLGKDRGVFRAPGETDTEYRARLFAIPGIVTPSAIIAAVNAILEPFTAVEAQYCEQSDAWFLNDGPCSWSSHVFANLGPRTDPEYPDRLYEVDASKHGGYFRPNSSPGGARIFNDAYGRFFLIRIPALERIDDLLASVYTSSNPSDNGFFIGTADGNTTFVYNFFATADTIYNQIVNTVERIRAHSIRWELLVDPTLS